ncbi:hypothetical protein KIN20_027523 [Parelaphostrongylus tenuis]|uniref:Metalloendopeptidase n=1 Tax=Parelaphostrongylus tenuis TaxID=148309 RepID=A0AAD5QZK9_PARTN|nr:hypothetical protein KIN20_027523 [Parelaphostrongylus tenuis]
MDRGIKIPFHSVGVAAHELAQSLGFHHMQSRYDRDDYITVVAENIQIVCVNMANNNDLENLFSDSFTEKVTLPQRSTFSAENKQSYLIGELKIRKHNGLFWRPYKTKTCVLLNNGYFLIYSTPVEGLSIYLPTVRNLSHHFSGGNSSNKAKARCGVEMCVGEMKLGVLIKGDLSTVVAWRRGIVCSHQGLPISEQPHPVNEEICNQSHVSREASQLLRCSLSNRSLPLNNTLPRVASCVRQRKCGVVCPGLRAYKALSLDARTSNLMHSHSFVCNNVTIDFLHFGSRYSFTFTSLRRQH